MNYPRYVEIENKKYKINTDFRIALRCNEIALSDAHEIERALAIIYLLFGDEGLEHNEHHQELLKKAKKYLACGKEIEKNGDKEPDMDFFEDWDYIEASFMSDYQIDLTNKKMHWWKFFKLINGLSNSEFGNCCVLNRIRNLRNYDISEIKDKKLKEQIIEAKKSVELKKKINKPTYKERKSAENFLKKLERSG